LGEVPPWTGSFDSEPHPTTNKAAEAKTTRERFAMVTTVSRPLRPSNKASGSNTEIAAVP
jgi:hypothetical protein